MDVLEIDAASNRGIDEIRDLREKVRYAPVEVRRKVYIIDEVHMLTPEAFNALLKTLEEPPGQALFILATTEPHKLPATIVSRCQRLDFRLIVLEEIVGRLRDVVRSGGRECSDAALYRIAEEAAGGMRDALSLLEQVLAFSEGTVGEEDVLAVLGAVGRDVFYELTGAFLNRDLARTLFILHDVAAAGKDLHNFTQQAIAYYRDLMVTFACEGEAKTLGIAPEWAARLHTQARQLGLGQIGRILSVLHELLGEVRWSARPRLLWELAIFRIFGLDRLYEDKSGFAGGSESTFCNEAPAPVVLQEQRPGSGTSNPERTAVSKAVQDAGPADLTKMWPRMLEQLKKESVKTHALLLSGEVGAFDGKVLEIRFNSSFLCDMMDNASNKTPLVNVLRRLLGTEPQIRSVLAGEAGPAVERRDPDELISSAVEIFRGKIIDESGKL